MVDNMKQLSFHYHGQGESSIYIDEKKEDSKYVKTFRTLDTFYYLNEDFLEKETKFNGEKCIEVNLLSSTYYGFKRVCLNKTMILPIKFFNSFNLLNEIGNDYMQDILRNILKEKNLIIVGSKHKGIDILYENKEIFVTFYDFNKQLEDRKNQKYYSEYDKRYLVKQKIGKFLNDCLFSKEELQNIMEGNFKLYNKSSVIEQIINTFKKELSDKFDNIKIEIISGEDIRKYYLEENYNDDYSESNDLLNSCMRYHECQNYMDIYVDNCEMAVIMDEENKIKLRTILWTDKNNKKYYDRIYGNAVNKLICKSFLNEKGYINLKEKEYNDIIIVPIKKKYTYFPYMDTMQYELKNKNNEYFLSTTDIEDLSGELYERHQEYDILRDLQSTCGNDEYECPHCGYRHHHGSKVILENGDYGKVCDGCVDDHYAWDDSASNGNGMYVFREYEFDENNTEDFDDFND